MVPGTAEAGLRADRKHEPRSPRFPDVSADGKRPRQRNGKFVTTSQRFCSVYLFGTFGGVRASDSGLVRYEEEGGMSGA
jgi:hypothetical protein